MQSEGLHPCTPNGSGPRKDLIDPIWGVFYHDIGKSLTGGTLVYRGSCLPELDGHHLYADYVVPRIWAASYDEDKGRVVANRPIRDPNMPVMSFRRGRGRRGVFCGDPFGHRKGDLLVLAVGQVIPHFSR